MNSSIGSQRILESECCRKIQKWFRNYTEIKRIKRVVNELQKELSPNDLQKLSNMCSAITDKCKGDGAGLTSGTFIDMFLGEWLKENLPQYRENRTGESDMVLYEINLSLKKINGKSTIALDWSKNKEKSVREHFSCHIVILNLKTEQWWKKTPIKTIPHIKMTYNDTISAGFYFIDKQYCKDYIKLASNNKTDTLIDQPYLYIMLKRSLYHNLFIKLPDANQKLEFNLLKAFS